MYRNLTSETHDYSERSSYQVMMWLGYDESFVDSIKECVKNSFATPNDYDSDNKFFKEDHFWQNLMRVNKHPSITLNNQTYHGNFRGADIAQAICEGFNPRPKVCSNRLYLTERGTDADFIHEDREDLHDAIMAKTLVITGIFLIIFNLAIVWIHKNYGNTAQQEKEMDDEINMAVSQYFALRGEDHNDGPRTNATGY